VLVVLDWHGVKRSRPALACNIRWRSAWSWHVAGRQPPRGWIRPAKCCEARWLSCVAYLCWFSGIFPWEPPSIMPGDKASKDAIGITCTQGYRAFKKLN
jgi:hypothetical protein